MVSSLSDRVRDYARTHYIDPARRRGEQTVTVAADEVQKGVRLSNRAPLVCQALRSRKFLQENQLELSRWEGPPSGVSTTVRFIYRLHENRAGAVELPLAQLAGLWGIGKEVFEELGGAEAFIRSEREQFHGPKDEA